MKAQLIDSGLNSKKNIRIKKVDQHYLDTPFHFHNSCEMVLIEESFGKRVVGDHVDNFMEGDLVLMGPDLPHIWQNDSVFFKGNMSFRAKAIVIYFSPAMIFDLAGDTETFNIVDRLIFKSGRGLRLTGVTRDFIAAEMGKMASEEPGLKQISLLLNIIDVISKSEEMEFLASEGYKNAYSHKDTTRFNDVYQFLINNFHKEISLEEIAGVARMTPNAFCRYFKTRTNKSFTAFINELRIGHACRLLRNMDFSIADISYKSGFNNMVNFNRFFKSITRKTPREFRNELKKTRIMDFQGSKIFEEISDS